LAGRGKEGNYHTSSQEMDDHNIGEDVKATPIWKHNYEEPVLAQQIDQISPEGISASTYYSWIFPP
jgi:hypothetical protein